MACSRPERFFKFLLQKILLFVDVCIHWNMISLNVFHVQQCRQLRCKMGECDQNILPFNCMYCFGGGTILLCCYVSMLLTFKKNFFTFCKHVRTLCFFFRKTFPLLTQHQVNEISFGDVKRNTQKSTFTSQLTFESERSSLSPS